MYSLLKPSSYKSFISNDIEYYNDNDNEIHNTYEHVTKFLTFGSHNNYINDAKQLVNQAQDTELFDETIMYTGEDLQNDKSFEKHNDFIKNNKRGYGYWLWKPYLIKKTMDQMKDGDILLYLDCGCEINPKEKSYVEDLFELVKKDYIIGSLASIEKEWTKMDLLLYLDMNTPTYLNTSQHQAGALLLLVCDKTRKLVNEWYEIGCNYHMIDDSPSIHKNLDCFKEHRHDQSIFSLLTKKYNLFSKTSIISPCVLYLRNKYDVSQIIINKKFIQEHFKERTIIFTWTNHVVNVNQTLTLNHWGIGDIIRGMIRSYQLSKKYNATFYIDIQTHPIVHYLKPVIHPYLNEVILKKDNIPFIMSNELEHYIKSNDDEIIYFLTNATFDQEITDNCRQFISSIFVPNGTFQSYIDSYSLPSNYVVYHYRFGDDEMLRGKKSEYSSSITHLTNHLKPNSTGILLSDSKSFKEAVRQSNISITVFDTKITHIGYDNDIKDTLFEFFVLSKASHIYTYSNYSWVPGFVKAANFIYNVPYTSIK